MPSHLSAADLEDALRFLQLQVSEPRELEARISACPDRRANARNAHDAAWDARAAWEAYLASKPKRRRRDIAELERLDDAAESTLNILRTVNVEGAADEVALRELSRKGNHSSAARQVVESRDLAGVLILARTAEFLNVEKLLDLCGAAVASFCTRGAPKRLLGKLTRALGGGGGVAHVSTAWDVRQSFLSESAISAIDSVCGVEGLNMDLRAGLRVVERHIRSTMEPRRLEDLPPAPGVCQACHHAQGRRHETWRRGPGGPGTLCDPCGTAWDESGSDQGWLTPALKARRHGGRVRNKARPSGMPRGYDSSSTEEKGERFSRMKRREEEEESLSA